MAWEEWKVRLTQDGLVGGSYPSLCIDRRTERLVNCWGDFFLEVLLVFDGGFFARFLGDVLCSFLLAMFVK